MTAGIGMSLVLDEFALILHLQDVYWSGEGQLSVQLVSLVAACLRLTVCGFSPFGVRDLDHLEVALRLTASAIFIGDGVLDLTCILKGKYRTALFGFFVPPIGWIGAVRLARPTSIWARHRYSEKRQARASRQAADFDRRWGPVQTFWDNLAGGKPSQPNPAPAECVPRRADGLAWPGRVGGGSRAGPDWPGTTSARYRTEGAGREVGRGAGRVRGCRPSGRSGT